MSSEESSGHSRPGVDAAPDQDEGGADEPRPEPAPPDPAAPESPGPPPLEAPDPVPARHRRLTAAGEVILCSGFPTQLTLVVLLGMLGAGPTEGSGDLSLGYVVTLSLVDAALILALVWMLMRGHGEHPVAVMVGRRPIRSELLLGLALVPAALLVVAAAFAVLSSVAPELRNVPENPLEALIRTPAAAMTFAVVAVVAGGLREEVQRAFILRRFGAAPRGRGGRARGVQRRLRPRSPRSGPGRGHHHRPAGGALGRALPGPRQHGGAVRLPCRLQRDGGAHRLRRAWGGMTARTGT